MKKRVDSLMRSESPGCCEPDRYGGLKFTLELGSEAAVVVTLAALTRLSIN